ncbi:MAG: peptide chain release factor H [Bacteroidota bacterium]
MKHQKYQEESLFIQVTSGRGPAECCWVVAQVLKTIKADCDQLKLSCQVIERQEGPENGTLASALVEVTGNRVIEQLESWKGTIQWIGKSRYRKFHKRKNWYVGVAFFKPQKTKGFQHSELRFETFRGSGPGGQHRNKVETAVRVKHVPSGIMASCSMHKSQAQNKKEALRKLEEAFKTHALEAQKAQVDSQWAEHTSLERGNAVKVFEGPKFRQLK